MLSSITTNCCKPVQTYKADPPVVFTIAKYLVTFGPCLHSICGEFLGNPSEQREVDGPQKVVKTGN